jgi:ABC-type nitrate/sulfonate/bicarbonate transport system substrate-binding protein
MRPGHIPRTLATVVAVATLAFGATACGVGASASSGGVTTIRYQSSAGFVNYLELADQLGYLEKVKIKRLGDVSGGPAMLQSVATNQADIALGPFQGAIAKVAASGVKLKAVVGYYGSDENVKTSLLVLAGSPIHGAKDLVGKKIAVNTLGANSEAVLDTWLRKEGLSNDDIAKVALVQLPSINAEAALRKGQVDGAILGFAAKEAAVKTGGLRSVFDDTDLVGPYTGGSVTFTQKFIDENPKTVRTVTTGIAKAIRYQQQHSLAKVRSVYSTWLKAHGRQSELPVVAAWKGNGLASPGGVLKSQDFELWFEWLAKDGQVDTDKLKVSDLYTNEFNPYADGKEK